MKRTTRTTRSTVTRSTGVMAAAAVLVLTSLAGPAGADPAGAGCPTDRLERLHALHGRLDALALDGRAGSGQYWYVDHRRCTLTLATLRGAADPLTTAFLTAARLVPALVEITEVDTPMRPRVARAPAGEAAPRAAAFHGGSTLYSGLTGTVFVCTAGFNGYRPNTTTTAGHCAHDAPTWYDGTGTRIGTVDDSRFPGADWAFVPGADGVTLAPDILDGDAITTITAFGRPHLDDRVCGTGAAGGTRCGTIDAVDVTVNYPEGPVTGLARSTQSGAAGDSGGPVHTGSTGVALISGGPTEGAPTFVQPLNF
ncbi:S1 family peptidase [Embleya hyalina]|uniref:Protease n=1 Tax=Embleya hyalina TaxID=516124 RepID=A0A401YGA2_9ACTN|nr:S1 family peptidase [Embleya hyalina]GCD93590.1 protease [Embleya hyalina]